MKVVVALEARFVCTPDGSVWTQTTFPYSFWMRYLEVFDSVKIVARTLDIPKINANWKRVDGKNVSCINIPYYIGPWQYLRKAKQVKQSARNAVDKKDAVILRVGSNLANCIEPMLSQQGHPFGLEVVADPYDSFAPGSVKHPLRPFFRWFFTRQLQRQCLKASATSYVTQSALQRRYPAASEAFSTYYSDVELSEESFVDLPRSPEHSRSTFTLIYLGTMAQLYKAPDILLKAVATCINDGLDLNVIAIGDGQYRSELEALAVNLGIQEKVKFLGQIPSGDAVRTYLDSADLFVLPSRQEGLPRAMVEAMARGLPCLGSTVGGIPELLSRENLVAAGDVNDLAQKIREVVTNPDRMASMSAQNLETAKNYQEKFLRQKWNEFYERIRQETETWREKQT